MFDVKIPKKGWRLNYMFQQPLISGDNQARQFLNCFSGWWSMWTDVKDQSEKLPRKKFSGLMHTRHALLDISDYCLNELGTKFVLLGKFHIDSLKFRFGQYRQLAGGMYNVLLRQVYKCKKNFVYCQF